MEHSVIYLFVYILNHIIFRYVHYVRCFGSSLVRQSCLPPAILRSGGKTYSCFQGWQIRPAARVPWGACPRVQWKIRAQKHMARTKTALQQAEFGVLFTLLQGIRCVSVTRIRTLIELVLSKCMIPPPKIIATSIEKSNELRQYFQNPTIRAKRLGFVANSSMQCMQMLIGCCRFFLRRLNQIP